jgi:phospholipase/carboxylesterase
LSGLPLAAVVHEPAGTVRHAVVWLHGLGADGHDFTPLVDALQLPEEPPIRFVLPHAPLRPVTVNGGMAMRAWYDIAEVDLERRVDSGEIAASVASVTALLDAQLTAGIPASNLVLAGFSQGGVIALQAGLGYAQRLAGIIGCSCYVPDPDLLAAARSPANTATPVLLAHGREDPVVPYRLGKVGRDLVAGFGNPVTWHPYAMQHAVCAEQVGDLRRWLLARLAPDSGHG